MSGIKNTHINVGNTPMVFKFIIGIGLILGVAAFIMVLTRKCPCKCPCRNSEEEFDAVPDAVPDASKTCNANPAMGLDCAKLWKQNSFENNLDDIHPDQQAGFRQWWNGIPDDMTLFPSLITPKCREGVSCPLGIKVTDEFTPDQLASAHDNPTTTDCKDMNLCVLT